MTRYVVATQREWGLDVLKQVARPTEAWSCRHFEPEDASEPEGGLLASLLDGPPPRYVFLLNWSRRLPESIWARHECVNFHCTDLPYGRGGHPVENLLLAGKAETVMAAHRVVGEIDAGPVYRTLGPISLRRHGPGGKIHDDLSKDEILARFVWPCVALIRHIVNKELEPVPQSGQIVRFSRLSTAAHREFWARRKRLREKAEVVT